MNSAKTLLILLVTIAFFGCSGVPVSKVAALHRGATKAAVMRDLGDSGTCSCQLISSGSEYELIRYPVGRRRDGYLFVFRDRRLMKISPEPYFGCRRLEANEPEDAAYDHAVEYIRHSPDVLAPDDPPANGPNWAGIQLAACWGLAMSPFLVMDIPLVPLVVAEQITAHAAARSPGDLQLHDPVATADAVFGKPIGNSIGANGIGWRQYHSRAGWFAFMDGLNWTDVLAVMSRDDRIVGVFGPIWLEGGAIPATKPVP